MQAAVNGHAGTLRLLLEHGADVNDVSDVSAACVCLREIKKRRKKKRLMDRMIQVSQVLCSVGFKGFASAVWFVFFFPLFLVAVSFVIVLAVPCCFGLLAP